MPAGAHALLRESDPAAGSSLDQAPRRVVLTFTERPEPGLTSIAGARHRRPAGPARRGRPGRGRAAAVRGRPGRPGRRHLHGQLAGRLQGRRPRHRRLVRLRGRRPRPGGNAPGPGGPPGRDPVPVGRGHRRPAGPLRRAHHAGRRGRHRPGRHRAGPPLGRQGAAGRRRHPDRGRRDRPVPGREGPHRRPPRDPPRLLDRPGAPPAGRRGGGDGGGGLVPGRGPAPRTGGGAGAGRHLAAGGRRRGRRGHDAAARAGRARGWAVVPAERQPAGAVAAPAGRRRLDRRAGLAAGRAAGPGAARAAGLGGALLQAGRPGPRPGRGHRPLPRPAPGGRLARAARLALRALPRPQGRAVPRAGAARGPQPLPGRAGAGRRRPAPRQPAPQRPRRGRPGRLHPGRDRRAQPAAAGQVRGRAGLGQATGPAQRPGRGERLRHLGADRPHRLAGHHRPEQLHRQGHRLRLRRGLAGHPGRPAVHAQGPAGDRRPRPST